jgi:hypothetical protein
MQWIRQNDISYVINKTIVTCARSNIDGSRPRKRYNPQLHQTQEVQSCKSTYCFECKWVKGPAVRELPPSLHCTTTRSLHRSSTCRGPTCTSDISVESAHVSTSSTEMKQSVDWNLVTKVNEKVFQHHLKDLTICGHQKVPMVGLSFRSWLLALIKHWFYAPTCQINV